MNAAMLVEFAARDFGERVALVDDEGETTYRELRDRAARIGYEMGRFGLQNGDHVALVGMPDRRWVTTYFGLLYGGFVVAPLSTTLRIPQYASFLSFAEAAGCIITSDIPEIGIGDLARGLMKEEGPRPMWLPPAADGVTDGETIQLLPEGTDNHVPAPAPVIKQFDDLALINFTSGTTGAPKAAEVSHGSDAFLALENQFAQGIQSDDIVGTPVGFFTGFGRVAALNPVMRAGATLAILPRANTPDFVEGFSRHRVTHFVGVPAMYHYLDQQHAAGTVDLEALAKHWRSGVYGGAPMPRSLWERFGALGIRLIQGYGMTEANGIAYSKVGGGAEDDPDTLFPVWGQHVEIVDSNGAAVPTGEVGQVLLRGPALLRRYFKNPEATRQVLRDQCLYTGDMARAMPGAGFVLAGRADDALNRGGFMVYPAEIEMTMKEHPAIPAICGRARRTAPWPDRESEQGCLAPSGQLFWRVVTATGR